MNYNVLVTNVPATAAIFWALFLLIPYKDWVSLINGLTSRSIKFSIFPVFFRPVDVSGVAYMSMAATKGVRSSLLALSAVLALAGVLSGCATDAPPPPPPLPPPAPAGPPVALAPEVSDLASVYVDYVETARKLRSDFGSGDSVQSELQAGASITPQQLARGAVAYAAIVAMQEPSFRSSLRAYASDPQSRADIVYRISTDVNYAASLPGAEIAARRVILALSSDGQSVYTAGAGVKQAAYDIQHQNWSKAFVTDPEARLAMAKQNSVTLKSVQSDESAQLLTAALTGTGLVSRATTGQSTGGGYVIQGDNVTTTQASDTVPSGGQSAITPGQTPAWVSTATDVNAVAQPASAEAPAVAGQTSVFDRPDLFNQPYTSAVNRALTVAALAILGEGGSDNADRMVSLLDEGDGRACLDMSKLNLYQCLAVAKPYYEDVFCLGQHILMDTGQCLGKMSSNALSFAPVVHVGFNADGSVAHADAEPYIKPAPVKPAKAVAKKTTTKRRRR
jgi:hypothetical protein